MCLYIILKLYYLRNFTKILDIASAVYDEAIVVYDEPIIRDYER